MKYFFNKNYKDLAKVNTHFDALLAEHIELSSVFSGLSKTIDVMALEATDKLIDRARGWHHHAAGGTGALHKIDGIMRQENYVDILK